MLDKKIKPMPNEEDMTGTLGDIELWYENIGRKNYKINSKNKMITLIISIVVIGVIYYFLTMLPLPAPFGELLKVVFVILAIVILLQFLGVGGLPNLR